MSTILLVEDAKELARILAQELETNGYRVCHAVDGEQALQMFQEFNPDLVILDWMLPKLDGLDVLSRLRQVSAVPVLMLTARKEEADRVIGLELGADDYLTKPFGMRELVARVRALLRRIVHVQSILAGDQDGGAAPIACGPLRLEPGSRTACLDETALNLTRTEFDLLFLLAKNPRRAFSRTYLLETVWGGEAISGDRSVDNTILRLRKKLGVFGEAIETVWGVGYRLKLPGKDET
jgi:DNA-binding response OmpR family regulator